jgi:hypothetical protein
MLGRELLCERLHLVDGPGSQDRLKETVKKVGTSVSALKKELNAS